LLARVICLETNESNPRTGDRGTHKRGRFYPSLDMTEVVTDPQGTTSTDGQAVEEPEERLTARDVMKIAGFVVLGILLLLLVLGVFRYLLVREYGGL